MSGGAAPWVFYAVVVTTLAVLLITYRRPR
jgi:hypothetical protein